MKYVKAAWIDLSCFLSVPLFHSFEYHFVSVVSVIERAVHTADGGSGSSGLLCDLQIGLVFLQHGSHFKTLGEGEELIYGT